MNRMTGAGGLVGLSVRGLSTQAVSAAPKATSELLKLRVVIEKFQIDKKLEGISKEELTHLSRLFYEASLDQESVGNQADSLFYDDCRKSCLELAEVASQTALVHEKAQQVSAAVLGMMFSGALALTLPVLGTLAGLGFVGMAAVNTKAGRSAGSDLRNLHQERYKALEGQKRSIDLELKRVGHSILGAEANHDARSLPVSTSTIRDKN